MPFCREALQYGSSCFTGSSSQALGCLPSRLNLGALGSLNQTVRERDDRDIARKLPGHFEQKHLCLLPDCLAARLPGELDTLEALVAHAEQAPTMTECDPASGQLEIRVRLRVWPKRRGHVTESSIRGVILAGCSSPIDSLHVPTENARRSDLAPSGDTLVTSAASVDR